MIYGNSTFDDLADVVNQTVEGMRTRLDEFDSIVVRGISGLAVGAPVALALGKPLVVVRKPNHMESSHGGGGNVVNHKNIGTKCVFLDDFRGEGKTEQDVSRAIRQHGGYVFHVYFYNRDGWHAPLHPVSKRMHRCTHEKRDHKRMGSCGKCLDIIG